MEPAGIGSPGASSIKGDQFFMVGGGNRVNAADNYANCYEYNPEDDSWTMFAPGSIPPFYSLTITLLPYNY